MRSPAAQPPSKPAGPDRRRDVAVWQARLSSLFLAVLVLAATMVGWRGEEAVAISPPESPVEYLIFLTALATFAARWHPLAALVVTAVLDALPYWLPIDGAGYHLGLMIAVYMVVAHRPRRLALPAVGIVLVIQVGLMAWDRDWLWLSVFVMIAAVTVLFPAALGAATRARMLATHALRERAVVAEQARDIDARKLLAEDRLRTARDLHDSVAHQIAVMNLNAGVASESLPDRPADAEAALVTIREAGRAVISSISTLLAGLRDEDWDDQEPRPDHSQLELLIEEFGKLAPDVTVTFTGRVVGADELVSPVLVSVVREALTNAYKHGRHGAPMVVTIHVAESSCTVEAVNTSTDTGPSVTEGFGLTGMRERLATVGGHLSIEREDNVFVLRAHVPSTEGRP